MSVILILLITIIYFPYNKIVSIPINNNIINISRNWSIFRYAYKYVLYILYM